MLNPLTGEKESSLVVGPTREREREHELFVLKAKWSGMEGKEGDVGMPVCPKNKRKTGWVD